MLGEGMLQETRQGEPFFPPRFRPCHGATRAEAVGLGQYLHVALRGVHCGGVVAHVSLGGVSYAHGTALEKAHKRGDAGVAHCVNDDGLGDAKAVGKRGGQRRCRGKRGGLEYVSLTG